MAEWASSYNANVRWFLGGEIVGALEAVTSSQRWIPTTLGYGEAGPYRAGAT